MKAIEHPSEAIVLPDLAQSNENKSLEVAIAQALAQARAACETAGANSSECAVAWEIVEELQAERSHREAAKHPTALEVHCIEHPEAVECLIYDL